MSLLALASCCLWAAAPQARAQVSGGSIQELIARQFRAERLEDAWKVDGRLEVAGMTPVTDFTQYTPNPGDPATQRTEVYVAYDDEALYVAARLHDTHADSILQQLSERDRLRNTDYFGVSINPYRDGINASNFVVTPANVQYDAKFTSRRSGGGNQLLQSGDRSWDAVWASGTRIDSAGWTAELRIPYSMLRFAEGEEQVWDINFGRQLRRRREASFWNPVTPTGPRFTTQMGSVAGLTGLRPPVRLQATPFVTAAVNHGYDPEAATRDRLEGPTFGGGLDVKYGLTDAFTLDMTLVPDFSNARSDDQVLNLTANEIAFDENRAFFTEGVELFNKGGYFYSRRVGGVPINRGRAGEALRDGEEVASNPTRAQLLNATKVSGRMGNGLGIGVFTALEGATQAVLRDTATGQTREVEVAPLTNYSVVSIDQNLPNNSFATLLNTNVMRAGSTYDANLTAVVWDLRDAANDWGLNGDIGVSQQFGLQRGTPTPENVFGHKLELDLDRLTGRLRYGIGYGQESVRYDANDLGLLFFNNSREGDAYAEYNWFEPFGRFNSAEVRAFGSVGFLYDPNVFNYAWAGARGRMTTREFFTFGGGFFSELTDSYEFQDTRTPGLGLRIPQYGEINAFISSDYRKPFALDVRGEWGRFYSDGRTSNAQLSVSPRFRVGDRLTFRTRTSLRDNKRFLGYIGHSAASAKTYALDGLDTGFGIVDETAPGYDGIRPDGIVFSYRDIEIVENELFVEYAFTANATLNLRARHYWSRVRHREYFEIQSVGVPLPTTYTGRDEDGRPLDDQSFNAFNVDGFFRWRFRPGSDAFLSYKTQSFYEGLLGRRYFANFRELGRDVVNSSLTLKVVVWLDWNELRGG